MGAGVGEVMDWVSSIICVTATGGVVLKLSEPTVESVQVTWISLVSCQSRVTTVAGHVPILGAVRFGGGVPATGTVSICGKCDCDCNGLP
ncbi:unnamed protein product [Parnassius apollo]|uniref:(apollo) hypothetical protein n=1 Tax=Parnassius apollo TaxID=110799 RepID=A0A8S3Y9N9_PARAO|nr:unnamed protein product [Parnassius apollo]